MTDLNRARSVYRKLNTYQKEYSDSMYCKKIKIEHPDGDVYTYIDEFDIGKKHEAEIKKYFYDDSFMSICDVCSKKKIIRQNDVKTYSRICVCDGDWVSGKLKRYGRLNSKNGDVYIGSFIGYLKSGFGVGKYYQEGHEGDVYIGDWKRGFFDGQGIYKFSCGNIYTGNFMADKMHGNGKMNYPNGSWYKCEWVDGVSNGSGVYFMKTPVGNHKYIGNIVDGFLNGKGTMVYDNGNTYTGFYLNNEKHGQGVHKLKSGRIYDGAWENDLKSGEGKMLYPNKNVYEGSWMNDKINGKGKKIWSDGRCYEGDWVDGQRTGHGVLTESDGSIYTGDFVGGQRTGYGVLTKSDGFIYTGNWMRDVKYGYGCIEYPDGCAYKGYFINDCVDGRGMFYLSNGDVYLGNFKSENVDDTEGNKSNYLRENVVDDNDDYGGAFCSPRFLKKNKKEFESVLKPRNIELAHRTLIQNSKICKHEKMKSEKQLVYNDEIIRQLKIKNKNNYLLIFFFIIMVCYYFSESKSACFSLYLTQYLILMLFFEIFLKFKNRRKNIICYSFAVTFVLCFFCNFFFKISVRHKSELKHDYELDINLMKNNYNFFEAFKDSNNHKKTCLFISAPESNSRNMSQLSINSKKIDCSLKINELDQLTIESKTHDKKTETTINYAISQEEKTVNNENFLKELKIQNKDHLISSSQTNPSDKRRQFKLRSKFANIEYTYHIIGHDRIC